MTQTLEEVKERVNTLEYALGSFIIQTEKAIFSMSNEVQSLSREMKDFKDEMKEFKTTSKKNAKKK